MSKDDGRWVADSTLGPRMRKSVEKVLGDLGYEGKTYYTARTGFLGDPVDPDDLRCYTTEIFLGVGDRDVHPDKAAHVERCAAAEREVKERFDYALTAKNYKDVIAAYAEALKTVQAARPVIDERRTREERAELDVTLAKIRSKEEIAAAEQKTLQDEVLALAPAGAKSIILAQLKEDRSDPQTDYFSNATQRSVVIGFSHKTREDFKELHRVAASFPDTAHLGSQEALTKWLADGHGPDWGHGYIDEHAGEHRDNFSMGSGNYLSDHGYDGSGSGWRVSRYTLPSAEDGRRSWFPHLTEIAPELKADRVRDWDSVGASV